VKSVALIAALVAAALAQHWEFEQVDSLVSSGLQMRCSPGGPIYLCYTGVDGHIRVAKRDTAWQFEDIDTLVARAGDGPSFAISPAGDPAMAAMRGLELDYVSRTDTGWVAEPTGFTGSFWGVYPKLGFDSVGAPSIAYCYNGYDLPGGVLFATKTDSSWAVDTVFWVVPQQMYAHLCSISDLEHEAVGKPHLFIQGGYGVADGDPPWSYSIGTWTPSGDSWLCRFVAGGGTFSYAQGLDLTIDANLHERVCFDSGDYMTTHFCCDSAVLNSDASYDAAIQVGPLGQSQVAFVVDSVLYFAYRTGCWHISTVPTGTDAGECELLLDSLGQPLIAFTSRSGVWLAHGVDVVGQSEERQDPTLHNPQLTASVVRSVLFLPVSPSTIRTSLFDMTGRKVMELHPGSNDVSRLSPGVYFMREAQAQAQAVQKFVVAR